MPASPIILGWSANLGPSLPLLAKRRLDLGPSRKVPEVASEQGFVPDAVAFHLAHHVTESGALAPTGTDDRDHVLRI